MAGEALSHTVEGLRSHPAVKAGRTRQSRSNVKDLRLSRGWRQSDLVTYAGVSIAIVRKAEHGYLLQLEVGSLLKLANALECGVADLFPILAQRLDRL